jgi:hypothetical protein
MARVFATEPVMIENMSEMRDAEAPQDEIHDAISPIVLTSRRAS